MFRAPFQSKDKLSRYVNRYTGNTSLYWDAPLDRSSFHTWCILFTCFQDDQWKSSGWTCVAPVNVVTYHKCINFSHWYIYGKLLHLRAPQMCVRAVERSVIRVMAGGTDGRKTRKHTDFCQYNDSTRVWWYIKPREPFSSETGIFMEN